MSKSRHNSRDLVTNWLSYCNDVLEDYHSLPLSLVILCWVTTDLSSAVNGAETEVLSSHIKCCSETVGDWLAGWLTVSGT